MKTNVIKQEIENWLITAQYPIDAKAALQKVLFLIDSMQKEPVSDSIDFEKELYKAFGQVKDFTLGVQIAKWFYDMGKNSKEPVSGNLEEASKEWLKPQLDKSYESYGYGKMMELTRFDGYAMLDAIEFGANWQKEQEYTCYEEAFEDGASWKKEQMMANAVETTVHIDAGNYPYIQQIELYDYDKDVPLAKEGDKYKVILIKENKDE